MNQSASFQGLNIDKNSIINLEKGKLPPQAIDLEEVVLGAMMIDKKGVDEVIDLLTAEASYKETHQFIFQAIFALFQKSELINHSNLLFNQKQILLFNKTLTIMNYNNNECILLISLSNFSLEVFSIQKSDIEHFTS